MLGSIGGYAFLYLTAHQLARSLSLLPLVSFLTPSPSRLLTPNSRRLLTCLAIAQIPHAVHIFVARWLGILPSSNRMVLTTILNNTTPDELRRAIVPALVMRASGFAIRRTCVLVKGTRIDCVVFGRPSRLGDAESPWMLFSNGNGELYELLAFKDYRRSVERILDGFEANGVLFNYPGVASSDGLPDRDSLCDAYCGMLRFVEEALHAKHIYLYGHSIGCGVQATAFASYPFKPGVKYTIIKSRTFSRLSTTASHMIVPPLSLNPACTSSSSPSPSTRPHYHFELERWDIKRLVHIHARNTIRMLIKMLGWELDNTLDLSNMCSGFHRDRDGKEIVIPTVILQTVRWRQLHKNDTRCNVLKILRSDYVKRGNDNECEDGERDNDAKLYREILTERWQKVGMAVPHKITRKTKRNSDDNGGVEIMSAAEDQGEDADNEGYDDEKKAADNNLPDVDVVVVERGRQKPGEKEDHDNVERTRGSSVAIMPPIIPLLQDDAVSRALVCFDGVIPREAALGLAALINLPYADHSDPIPDDNEHGNSHVLVLGVKEWHNQSFRRSVIEAIANATRAFERNFHYTAEK
eukprot:CAMPEP_0114498642 /NCGR_PEP_ID=MMETSP0109-20121206/6983_1 /TAXON_ID=29199 /ORGANISM="Chlorarachnion reptans, Strain CCCM449" /LENGTH=580 /DNA_ID=CAMNT_0001676137 /DNA_START=369 /DNA_END=2111 /DNA_ORIENTATION=-